MDVIAELGLLLRPAGGGLYVVSSGKAEQLALQKRLYQARDEAEVAQKFRESLAQVRSAKAILLGVPSDVGAGYLRGANMGPAEIREVLYTPTFLSWMTTHSVIDIGDVFVVPQLLHDEMLSEAQLAASRRALYPSQPEALPVSPLSITERALDLVFQLNPSVMPVVIGGDHSVAWPVVSALSRARRDRWAIVQPDAHTDLLSERLGVKYCFGTWSYHANELLGRDGRLVQVGIRASRHDRGHWESTLGVRQFWAEECRTQPKRTIDAIVSHLKSIGVTAVYLSNDIDGTDEAFADATGTPEPGGFEPDFLVELIRRLGKDIGLLGGDVMEVAPPLQRRPGGGAQTTALACRYLRETLAAILAVDLPA